MDKNRIPRDFFQLTIEDKDLTMFTATDLKLVNKEFGNMVYMALKLKRKVATPLSPPSLTKACLATLLL